MRSGVQPERLGLYCWEGGTLGLRLELESHGDAVQMRTDGSESVRESHSHGDAVVALQENRDLLLGGDPLGLELGYASLRLTSCRRRRRRRVGDAGRLYSRKRRVGSEASAASPVLSLLHRTCDGSVGTRRQKSSLSLSRTTPVSEPLQQTCASSAARRGSTSWLSKVDTV